jgi:hypothetical protein
MAQCVDTNVCNSYMHLLSKGSWLQQWHVQGRKRNPGMRCRLRKHSPALPSLAPGIQSRINNTLKKGGGGWVPVVA